MSKMLLVRVSSKQSIYVIECVEYGTLRDKGRRQTILLPTIHLYKFAISFSPTPLYIIHSLLTESGNKLSNYKTIMECSAFLSYLIRFMNFRRIRNSVEDMMRCSSIKFPCRLIHLNFQFPIYNNFPMSDKANSKKK